MAVTEQQRRAGPYQGDGANKNFPFEFKVFASTELRVVVADSAGAEAELGQGYSVTLNKDQDHAPGGVVALDTALDAGSKLVIISDVKYEQPMVLTNQGGFYPEVLNRSADRQTILIQQIKERVDRSLTVPVTETKTPEDLTNELLAAQKEAAIYADQAAQSAASAAQSAKDATVVTGITNELHTVVDHVSYIKTDALAIDSIKSSAEHSNAIQIIAADFATQTACPNVHDFGYFNADDIPSYTPTGGSIAKVAGGIGEVRQVAPYVDSVVQNADAISKVGGSILKVNTVATDIVAVKTVADNIVAVKNAAGVVTDLNASIKRVEVTAATVQANQQAALDAATTATAKATAAEKSAIAAKASETSASAYATSASGSASTSTTKAAEALNSATAAKASETAAASSAASAAADAKKAQDAVSAVGSPLAKLQNLADLPDKAAARTNLGLGSMAQANLDFGTWSA